MLSIPTDSPKKFVTIAGLAIAVIGTSFGLQTFFDREAEKVRLIDEIRPFFEVQRLEALRMESAPASHVKDLVALSERVLDNARQTQVKLQAYEQRLHLSSNVYIFKLFISVFGLLVGGIVFLRGFRHWEKLTRDDS